MKMQSLPTQLHTQKVVTSKISRFLQNQNQIPLLVLQTGTFLSQQ